MSTPFSQRKFVALASALLLVGAGGFCLSDVLQKIKNRPELLRTVSTEQNSDHASLPIPLTTVICHEDELLVYNSRENLPGKNRVGGKLVRQSMHGGPPESVLEGQFVACLSMETELLLLDAREPGIGPWMPIGSLGFPIRTYREPDHNERRGAVQKRRDLRGFKRTAATPIVCRIQRNSSPLKIEKTPVDVEGWSLATIPHVLTPKGLLWVRPGKLDSTFLLSMRDRRENHSEAAARDTVMFTPFGGKPEVIQKGRLCDLESGTLPDGVVLTEVGVFPKPVEARYRIGYDDVRSWNRLKITKFGNIFTDPDDQSGQSTPFHIQKPLVLLGQRYFQVGTRYSSGNDYNNSGGVYLLSWDRDGSDFRGDKIGGLDASMESDFLRSDSANLYLIYHRSSEKATAGNRSYFLRVLDPRHPETSSGGDMWLANATGLDLNEESVRDGYLFFRTSEAERDWINAFQKDVSERRIEKLWRLKLPDN